jgi:hypothetical protein
MAVERQQARFQQSLAHVAAKGVSGHARQM